MTKLFFLLPAAYILGSLPCGVILTRLFANINIQEAGSGNIGAHNVYRLTGIKLGLATLICDLLKGALPVFIAVLWTDPIQPPWRGELWMCFVALCAFSGHIFSIFLKFKGGKGVATAAGSLLVLSPMAFFVCLLVYVLVICSTGYSSAASLSAALLLPFASWLATSSVPIALCALVMSTAIFVRHSDNIIRLIRGTEDKPFHHQ